MFQWPALMAGHLPFLFFLKQKYRTNVVRSKLHIRWRIFRRYCLVNNKILQCISDGHTVDRLYHRFFKLHSQTANFSEFSHRLFYSVTNHRVWCKRAVTQTMADTHMYNRSRQPRAEGPADIPYFTVTSQNSERGWSEIMRALKLFMSAS